MRSSIVMAIVLLVCVCLGLIQQTYACPNCNVYCTATCTLNPCQSDYENDFANCYALCLANNPCGSDYCTTFPGLTCCSYCPETYYGDGATRDNTTLPDSSSVPP